MTTLPYPTNPILPQLRLQSMSIMSTSDVQPIIQRLDTLTDSFQGVLAHLERLSISLTAQTTGSLSAHASSTQAPTGKRKSAPPPTPTTGVPAAANIQSVSTRSALEKLTLSISIPDSLAGHVVGRAGTGLCQIHDFSQAKISISPSGSSGAQLVTIRW